MSETLKRIDDFKKEQLRLLLNQCTSEQINFFNRMYGSIDEIKQEKILHAIRQCERQIEKNKEEINE